MEQEAARAGEEPDPGLTGDWSVRRSGGLLPPLVGVRKHIAAGRGWTAVGRARLLPFDVRGDELRYRLPLRGLVDVVQRVGPDEYAGTAIFHGRTIGRFRMTRLPTGR